MTPLCKGTPSLSFRHPHELGMSLHIGSKQRELLKHLWCIPCLTICKFNKWISVNCFLHIHVYMYSSAFIHCIQWVEVTLGWCSWMGHGLQWGIQHWIAFSSLEVSFCLDMILITSLLEPLACGFSSLCFLWNGAKFSPYSALSLSAFKCSTLEME